MSGTVYINKHLTSADHGVKRQRPNSNVYRVNSSKPMNFRWGRFRTQFMPKGWTAPDFTGEKTSLKEPQLVELVEAEKESFSEENYFAHDWDGLGAEAVSQELFYRCIAILKKYARALSLENVNNLQVDIDPLPTGSIDTVWYGNEARLLMNFDFDEQGAVLLRYYGESEDRLGSIKNQLRGEAPSSVLLAWMNEHF